MSLIPLRWPAKDPNSIVRRGVDWSAYVSSGTTVNSCSWITASAGAIVIDSQTDTASICSVFLSAGAAGNYYFTCRAFLSDGEQEDQTIQIDISER